MNKISNVLTATLIAVLFIACGGKEVKLSEKGKLLSSINWKLQAQEVINEATDKLKDSTGITADIKLDGDVGDFMNFLAETLVFGIDSTDPSKLSFSRTIGEYPFSSETIGRWEFNENETILILTEWNDTKNAPDPPVKYEIKELTAEKLVLLKEGTQSPYIYRPK